MTESLLSCKPFEREAAPMVGWIKFLLQILVFCDCNDFVQLTITVVHNWPLRGDFLMRSGMTLNEVTVGY